MSDGQQNRLHALITHIGGHTTYTVDSLSFELDTCKLTRFAGIQGLELVKKSELDGLLLNDVRQTTDIANDIS